MSAPRLALPSVARGLSARLLVLTIGFVMLSEILIYLPSIARFRLTYLEGRITAAYLSSLALQLLPDDKVDYAVELELLRGTQLRMMAIKRKQTRTLVLSEDMPPKMDASFDIRDPVPLTLIVDAFEALLAGNRVIHVKGRFPDGSDGYLEIMMDEAPLREAMVSYSVNILQLSIVISLLTAGLVYLALHILFVRPMRRITAAMAAFRQAPEDAGSVIQPSERSDEIGTAQRELARMQEELRAALQQRAHLAALGAAVGKVNHDLRNVLSTAQLVSDRLANSEDPEVRRATPTLLRAIDHAIAICTETLRFARAENAVPERRRFQLKPLVEDVGQHAGLPAAGGIAWDNRVADEFEVTADREQLFRVLLNLGRNAIQAMGEAGRIVVEARREGGEVAIEVADSGPGLSAKAREHLFEPFAGSARPGGFGLGLAIARELARGHGGELELVRSDGGGTVFRLRLPEPAAGARAAR
jgi:signal transduction histidine kinase